MTKTKLTSLPKISGMMEINRRALVAYYLKAIVGADTYPNQVKP